MTSEIVPTPAGQAALFDDPAKLLTIPLADLRVLAHDLARTVDGPLTQIRRAVGLVCWAMRQRLPDKAYGDWMADYGEMLKLSSRTLYEWRRGAETSLALPVPDGRREGRPPRETAGRRTELQIPAIPAPDPVVPDAGIAPPSSGRTDPSPQQAAGVDPPSPRRRPRPAAGEREPAAESHLGAGGHGVRGEPVTPGSGHETPAGPGLLLPDYPSADHVARVVRWLTMQLRVGNGQKLNADELVELRLVIGQELGRRTSRREVTPMFKTGKSK